MLFNNVLPLLQEGKMIRRQEWPKDCFVFRQVPAVIPDSIVPKMQSLPDDVKKEFERRFNDASFQIKEISYCYQLAYVNQSNLVSSANLSNMDLLCEDWEIYNPK